jgi:hypothetical protein
MSRSRRTCLLVVIAFLTGIACQLKRPQTVQGRVLEPQLLEPRAPESTHKRADTSAAECFTSNRLAS